MHLKMPNNRTGNDTKHLIISEPLQTPVRKNKAQQLDSKTQSLRSFLEMLRDCIQAKEGRISNTKLYPYFSDLGSD